MSRYKLVKSDNGYAIIDKFPFEVVIETFYDDEYDIAKETYDIYIDEEKKNKSRQLDRQKGEWQ